MGTSAVIEKIKKLLALSNSSNEHEAALAATHAQRLLSEHNLAMTDIDTKEQPQVADKVETAAPKTLPKWLRHLSSGVSTAFDCRAIHYPSQNKISFIGVGADVQIASYTFVYLEKTVKKLCLAYMKQYSSTNIQKRNLELLRQSYYLGAVSTINNNLEKQKIKTPITAGALVPIKEGLIKKTLNDIGYIRTIRSRRSFINHSAYNQGKADGSKVTIHKGVTGDLDSLNLLTYTSQGQ